MSSKAKFQRVDRMKKKKWKEKMSARSRKNRKNQDPRGVEVFGPEDI